jgi:hypothetical protein
MNRAASYQKTKSASISPSEDRCIQKFVAQHTAPHKVSPRILKRALTNENLCAEVARRYKSHRVGEKKDQESAEDLVAQIITQTFHYMVGLQVPYGYPSTGEAFVFLMFDQTKPETLYYHLVVPKEQVQDSFDIFSTAVCQVACFCLMTLKSELLSDKWRQRTIKKLPRWPHTTDQLGGETTGEDRGVSPAPSNAPYSAPIPTTTRPSKYGFRSQGRSACEEQEVIGDDETDSE